MTTLHLIDKLLTLGIFVVIATAVWSMYPRRIREVTGDRKESVQERPPEVEAPPQPQYAPVFLEREEVVAKPLIVRDLTDKATLLVRHRMNKRACTAHLIIWSGAKRKSISDSYYDLGVIEAAEPNDTIVEEFMVMAKERLNELALEGKRKRRRKAVEEVKQEDVAATTVIPSQGNSVPGVTEQVIEPPSVVVEDSPPESIRMRKFPSVYRGVITEIGMMEQSKNGSEFSTFGVRYRTPEGIEDAVFGANLRGALREANATIGDSVEILKIGRKTIDPKKAPMNLFKVAKLAAAAA